MKADRPPPYWNRACRELSARDAVLERLIAAHRREVLRGSGDPFRTIMNAVVGQQISVAAAAGIWRRLLDAFPGLDPQAVAAAEAEALRAVGLSRRKVEYVRGIAAAFTDGSVDPREWEQMTDDEIRAALTSLRGVGPWTADMLLVFHIRRPDVLPLGDLGLVNAAARLYGWRDGAGPAGAAGQDPAAHTANRSRTYRELQRRLAEHAERWRPWRTVATWFIWRDLDAEPVIY